VGKKKKFNDHPFAYRQEIELEIVTLTNLGLGLGRVALARDSSGLGVLGSELPPYPSANPDPDLSRRSPAEPETQNAELPPLAAAASPASHPAATEGARARQTRLSY